MRNHNAQQRNLHVFARAALTCWIRLLFLDVYKLLSPILGSDPLLPQNPAQEKYNNSCVSITLMAIRDVDEFVSSSDLEKCSIASVSQQWMLCSEWVPSEWESDKNITIIYTTPVHLVMSYEAKSCMFVRIKSIITIFLTKIWVHNP